MRAMLQPHRVPQGVSLPGQPQRIRASSIHKDIPTPDMDLVTIQVGMDDGGMTPIGLHGAGTHQHPGEVPMSPGIGNGAKIHLSDHSPQASSDGTRKGGPLADGTGILDGSGSGIGESALCPRKCTPRRGWYSPTGYKSS